MTRRRQKFVERKRAEAEAAERSALASRRCRAAERNFRRWRCERAEEAGGKMGRAVKLVKESHMERDG